MEATALTINQNSIQAQAMSAGLIQEFVDYIDRGAKTTRTYINNLRQFFAYLKYRAIARPIRQDVINYRKWLGQEHEAVQLAPETPEGWSLRRDKAGNVIMIICRPGTVRQYLRSVKQFFKWTAAAGYYPDIATNIHPPKVSGDTHRKEALTAEQVLKIEKSIQAGAEARREDAEAAYKDTAGRVRRADEQGKRLYAMYLLAVNAGLRTIEIHRANIKDLEIKDGQARLYVWGKGHTEPDQIKALAPEVAQAIRDYLDIRTDKTGNSPLFVSTGNRSGGKRIATTTISTMLKRAMQAAGYDSERLTAHSLRHTAGTGVMEITGNNIFSTQKYMRHSDPKTTEIYLHVDQEKAEAGIAADLYSYYHGGQQQQDSRQKLEALINRLDPSKLDKLAAIAAAIA